MKKANGYYALKMDESRDVANISNEETQLVELSCDSMLKGKFSVVSFSQFWCIVITA